MTCGFAGCADSLHERNAVIRGKLLWNGVKCFFQDERFVFAFELRRGGFGFVEEGVEVVDVVTRVFKGSYFFFVYRDL